MSEIIIEEEVAAILKPRRMRTYTPEELERKRERLRVARERKKSLTEPGQESLEPPQIHLNAESGH